MFIARSQGTHSPADCWYNPTRSKSPGRKAGGKAAGKAGGKAGGKGGKAFSGQCNYCKKTGHKSTDCFKKQADEAKAGGVKEVVEVDSDEFGQCMAITDESACMGKHIIVRRKQCILPRVAN